MGKKLKTGRSYRLLAGSAVLLLLAGCSGSLFNGGSEGLVSVTIGKNIGPSLVGSPGAPVEGDVAETGQGSAGSGQLDSATADSHKYPLNR